MKKTLITGGAGFIGYHLAKRLLKEGQKVTLVDNFFRGKRDEDFKKLLKEPNVSLIEADLTDPKAFDKVDSGYDYVYHLVGINGTKLFYEIPQEVLRIGVSSTMNVLDWFYKKNRIANKSSKILYTSSNEAYASALDAFGKLPLPTPENVPLVIADTYNSRWSYGGQKLIGELFFIHYAKAYNFPMVIVRPHNFYGPRGGYEHVIPEFIERIEKKVDPFPIYGANMTRTFCYIDDAVEAMQMVMESNKTNNGTYHIGQSPKDEISMQDLAKRLFETAGWTPKKVEIKNAPEGCVLRRAPDVSKIKNDLGWQVRTNLKDGLFKTFDWYKRHPKK